MDHKSYCTNCKMQRAVLIEFQHKITAHIILSLSYENKCVECNSTFVLGLDLIFM